MLRIVPRLSSVVAVVVGSLFTMGTVCGETLYQSNVDTRVVVALQVRPEAVQQWLSGPGRSALLRRGHQKGPTSRSSLWTSTSFRIPRGSR